MVVRFGLTLGFCVTAPLIVLLPQLSDHVLGSLE